MELTIKQKSVCKKWLSHQNKQDILFLLASISGHIIIKHSPLKSIKRLVRVSIDGTYLMIGGEEQIMLNNKELSISKGIDNNYQCIKNIKNTNSFLKDNPIKNSHCFTLRSKNQTFILETTTVFYRQMWTKGLCHLIQMTKKQKEFRYSIVKYVM